MQSIALVILFALAARVSAAPATVTATSPSTDDTTPASGSATAPRIAIENAPAPLYDDPVWHGAADPAVVWMPGKGAAGEYWMYYTQRRASMPDAHGVEWVYGSAIGIATSPDGIHWSYGGVIEGSIPIDSKPQSLADPVKGNLTLWAPTVFWEGGNGIAGGGKSGDRLHMFVTLVHGIFTRWAGDGTIEHFVSTDGRHWTYVSTLPLASRRCIDPTVYRIGDTWYLWYKNEGGHSHTYMTASKDLTTWQDQGEVIRSDFGHEAPFVWHWKGAYWDLQDRGSALDAWRSEKGTSDWTFNSLILEKNSTGLRPHDQGTGHHPWIILQSPAAGPAKEGDEQLVLFYFTEKNRLSWIQMAEITLGPDGKLACDRNKYLTAGAASTRSAE